MKKILGFTLGILIGSVLFLILLVSAILGIKTNQDTATGSYTEAFTADLPVYSEIKGNGQISDEVARFAVGTAVKYHLLPSVVLSQYAYESSWGKSASATEDNNNFGITWYSGAPFPKGTERGSGGSEGGNYMHFPNQEAGFSYYGYMIATQSNFNASVGNKNPGEVLLILGKGGYASAGITADSPYYTNCISIIKSNKWESLYDKFAIKHWSDSNFGNGATTGGGGKVGNLEVLQPVLGTTVDNGQCYMLSSYYASKIDPQHISGGLHSGMAAADIGLDYPWSSWGWKVFNNPQYTQIKAGDIINFNRSASVGGWTTDPIYGHTGVVAEVKGNNQLLVYDQAVSFPVTLHTYQYYNGMIESVVEPPK